jgi:hypothetical protein
MAAGGIVGLIHPESHFTEARAGLFRQEVYQHLRRHWHFQNLLRLFSEISHKTEFGVSVYGSRQNVSFMSASSLYAPETVDRSLLHDASGEEPGLRDDDGKWDTRPHAARILHVDDVMLSHWANIIDAPGTPIRQARMLRVVNSASQEVISKMALTSRFGGRRFKWTPGWHETADRQAGYFVMKSAIPETWASAILKALT